MNEVNELLTRKSDKFETALDKEFHKMQRFEVHTSKQTKRFKLLYEKLQQSNIS